MLVLEAGPRWDRPSSQWRHLENDANNPVTNPFNSSISRLGTRISAKNPDHLNQLGFDADVIDATGIETRKTNGFTSDLIPSLQTVFPTAGSAAGGTTVVIRGADFSNSAVVRINSVQQSQSQGAATPTGWSR